MSWQKVIDSPSISHMASLIRSMEVKRWTLTGSKSVTFQILRSAQLWNISQVTTMPLAWSLSRRQLTLTSFQCYLTSSAVSTVPTISVTKAYLQCPQRLATLARCSPKGRARSPPITLNRYALLIRDSEMAEEFGQILPETMIASEKKGRVHLVRSITTLGWRMVEIHLLRGQTLRIRFKVL